MRHTLLACGLLLAAGASCRPANTASILLTNPLDVDRTEVVSIAYEDFASKFGTDTIFRLYDAESNNEIPYQFERLGGPSIQHVLLWVEIPGSGSIKIHAEKGEHAQIESRTFARYVPERKDDFAWENDKIAFRAYGAALEDYPSQMAYGIDVWAKRTSRLVIDEWYRGDDYHKDHGDGLDYYSVGLTLGAGGIAPYPNGQIAYSKNYRGHEVLDNGPLRSTFKLTYAPWQAGVREVWLEKVVSIDAGSQMSHVLATFHYAGDDSLPVVAGIVLRKEEGAVINEGTNGFVAYWEPAHGDDGTLGIAVASLHPISEVLTAENQLLSLFNATNGEPVRYYHGAAWNKAGEITTAAAWQRYLADFVDKQRHPIQIRIQ